MRSCQKYCCDENEGSTDFFSFGLLIPHQSCLQTFLGLRRRGRSVQVAARRRDVPEFPVRQSGDEAEDRRCCPHHPVPEPQFQPCQTAADDKAGKPYPCVHAAAVVADVRARHFQSIRQKTGRAVPLIDAAAPRPSGQTQRPVAMKSTQKRRAEETKQPGKVFFCCFLG